MTSYKAFLFDLFHTLVDVAAAPGISGRYTADILGVDRSDWNRACFSDLHEICRPTRHTDVVRALAHSIDPSISEERIAQATEERQRRFDHALLNVEEDTLQRLETFKRLGYRLALVSNASTGEVSAWQDSPLADCFDATLFSWKCGMQKPDSAIYHEALRQLDCRNHEALFIGDGGSNEHRGANAIGLDNVLLTRYLQRIDAERLTERRAWVKWEIAHLNELLELLGQ
jgi:putative hydrolase of the HAD superfamily